MSLNCVVQKYRSARARDAFLWTPPILHGPVSTTIGHLVALRAAHGTYIALYRRFLRLLATGGIVVCLALNRFIHALAVRGLFVCFSLEAAFICRLRAAVCTISIFTLIKGSRTSEILAWSLRTRVCFGLASIIDIDLTALCSCRVDRENRTISVPLRSFLFFSRCAP